MWQEMTQKIKWKKNYIKNEKNIKLVSLLLALASICSHVAVMKRMSPSWGVGSTLGGLSRQGHKVVCRAHVIPVDMPGRAGVHPPANQR